MVTELIVGNAPLALLASGLVLMALEAVSPGAHLIVIGVALAGAGLIGLLFPPAGGVLALAGLTLVIGLAATWIYREFDFYGGKGTAQTSNSASLAGATGYATEPITARSGQVKLDGGGFTPYYTARTNGDRIEEDEEILVLDPGGGNVLTVEAMDAIGQDEIDLALAREGATNASIDTDADSGDETPSDGARDASSTETDGERSLDAEPPSDVDSDASSDADPDSDRPTDSETESEAEAETDTEAET